MKSIPPLFAFLLFTLPLFAADPAGQVEENRRIEQEIRNLEARWTEQANANKQRERENRNLERVIAQQQAVIAEIGADDVNGRFVDDLLCHVRCFVAQGIEALFREVEVHGRKTRGQRRDQNVDDDNHGDKHNREHISQLAVLILSIDAPLRMLLDNEHTKQFIPQALHKVNAHGVHSNGIKMVAVLSGSIILAQSFVPGAAAVLRQLTKLNSVCMPMRYLWVFAAYIALRNAYDTIPAEYRFVKNQAVAKFFGGWCFAVTAVCCVLGMYDKDPFTFALNVITPVVLTVLGFILPALAKREQTAAKK